jgi:hypothetical protein
VRGLTNRGLSLANPTSGVVVAYDSEGQRFELDATVELDALQEEYRGVQLWFDPATDLYVSWESGGSTLTAAVDGLTQMQTERVAGVLSSLAFSLALGEGTELRIELMCED